RSTRTSDPSNGSARGAPAGGGVARPVRRSPLMQRVGARPVPTGQALFPHRLPGVPVEIDIDHVARLARLQLSDEEKERLRVQLGLILDHAARVQEVAADDVPPTSYAVPAATVFRPAALEPS